MFSIATSQIRHISSGYWTQLAIPQLRNFSKRSRELPLRLFASHHNRNEQKQEMAQTENKYDHYRNEAFKEKCQKNFQKAIEYYTLAIQEKEPIQSIAFAKWGRGNTFREMGQFDEAIKDLEESLQEDPSPDIEPFRDLSDTYQEIGKPSKAIEVLKAGVKHMPECKALHYELGEVYLKTNNTKLALMHLEEIIKLAENTEQRLLDPRLDEFLPTIKTTISQLRADDQVDTSTIYTSLRIEITRMGYHPFYLG